VSPLRNARILLGVTGSVAAYKAADLASRLVQSGAQVDTILTAGALQFVQPLLFTALTRRSAYTDLADGWSDHTSGHVSLAAAADLFVVAPASANAIARLALGLADDLLGTTALSATAPLIIAPAMEHGMWHHPAVIAHVATLQARGAVIIPPEPGRLASGATGDGRLASVEAILGHIRGVLGRGGLLAGRHVVVTAGGTQEAVDPVRFLGNRSSGRMGFALALAALDAGASVTLITAPTHLPPPIGAQVVRVESAVEMQRQVNAAVETASALVMAAAVADFRPAVTAARKIKKRDGEQTWSLPLTRNDDILASISRPGLVKIGFAAETDDLLRHAEAKLAHKGLAMIVANDAMATIGQDRSTAILLRREGAPEFLPEMDKGELAEVIMSRIAGLLPPLARESDE